MHNYFPKTVGLSNRVQPWEVLFWIFSYNLFVYCSVNIFSKAKAYSLCVCLIFSVTLFSVNFMNLFFAEPDIPGALQGKRRRKEIRENDFLMNNQSQQWEKIDTRKMVGCKKHPGWPPCTRFDSLKRNWTNKRPPQPLSSYYGTSNSIKIDPS